jgi:hypothetical protein
VCFPFSYLDFYFLFSLELLGLLVPIKVAANP